jgi:hypothetical protein
MKAYQAKNGNTQYKPSKRALMQAIEHNYGFCLACGAENEGIEPDASKYTCTSCEAPKVYGAEELLLMNLFH